MNKVNKIIYLDAAASSLKPVPVITAETDFLTHDYANSGRGICARAAKVDDMVESARGRVAKLLNADSGQIIFTSGTTDGMNRIADMLPAGSVVGVSDLDHHSARLPMQEKHKTIVCALDSDFNIDVMNLPTADAIVITAMSNVLGMPQPVKEIILAARAKNPKIITIVDAAQYVAHFPIDVRDWDCDALCFSGHKIGSDTGIGIMYLKEPEIWNTTKFGGGTGWMADDGKWMLSPGPSKFEPGTLPLTQIAGLIPAIENIKLYYTPHSTLHTPHFYMYDELSKIERIKIITKRESALLTFTVDDMHVLDFGAMMGAHGVCLRVGNMCASWLHKLLGVPGTIRISTGFWNTMEQAAEVISIIKKITDNER